MRMTVLVPALLVFALAACEPAPAEDPDVDADGFLASEDCDDDNANVYPGAPDFRGDGCDANCGTEADADGDDWPDDADCGPEDATTFPCSDAEVDGDTVDSDCDGVDGIRGDTCNSTDPNFADTPELTASCEPV